MNNNYIPNSDDEFVSWSNNFSTYLIAHASDMEVDTSVATAIGADVSTFRINLNNHVAAQDAAHAACEVKDEKRDATETAIRKLVRQLQASPVVTDAQREALGIPVHSEGRRAMAAAAATRPIGSVDTAQRLRHTIRYWDESTPNKRAKPDHTLGCEIWHVITAPDAPAPMDPSAYRNMGVNTASPFVADFNGADAGKMVHYLLRWVGTTGQSGPWSEVISATIVG